MDNALQLLELNGFPEHPLMVLEQFHKLQQQCLADWKDAVNKVSAGYTEVMKKIQEMKDARDLIIDHMSGGASNPYDPSKDNVSLSSASLIIDEKDSSNGLPDSVKSSPKGDLQNPLPAKSDGMQQVVINTYGPYAGLNFPVAGTSGVVLTEQHLNAPRSKKPRSASKDYPEPNNEELEEIENQNDANFDVIFNPKTRGKGGLYCEMTLHEHGCEEPISVARRKVLETEAIIVGKSPTTGAPIYKCNRKCFNEGKEKADCESLGGKVFTDRNQAIRHTRVIEFRCKYCKKASSRQDLCSKHVITCVKNPKNKVKTNVVHGPHK